MDRIPVAPLKSSSFSTATSREEKLARNFSLGPIKLTEHIKEAQKENAGGPDAVPEEAAEPDLAALSAEIDAFLAAPRDGDAPPAVSEVTLDKFASAVEQEIAQSEGTDDKWAPNEAGDAPPLLAAIRRLAALASTLTADNAPGGATTYTIGVHRITGVLHRAMTFVEDEFHGTLEDPRVAKVAPQATDTGSATGKSLKRPPSFGHGAELDRCVVPTLIADASPPFPPETVGRLRAMVEAMFAAGYETECTQVFLIARRNALDASLQSLGYEKASIDDVVKMPWEALESEIATWIKAFQHTVEVDLPGERDLCARVFAGGQRCLGRDIFADLAHCAILHMLTFTEAVVLTKRAAEKLFKVLDMYEAIRDAVPRVDAFLVPDDDGGERGPSPADEDGGSSASSALVDLKHELSSVRTRLGESAAAIFCDLEGSIRADAGKQPVPGGAVHPLTRYLMNYLKYACEYKKTLEQVFQEYRRTDDDAEHEVGGDPFAAQLMEVMELLHGNLEAKSRLYKDPSLSSIFLMNNGRYMLQKIRGSPEINAVVGEAWSRKRSTDLRQYHKNYQRETWSRVLNLLRDDGVITVKSHVQKQVLKDRFKQFNAAIDEIQRTQGSWVVSDEQLQSELRVSIAAVIVPAYRSFLGRFSQHFTAGRQAEKYVKLSGEDLEAIIEELFDGNAVSMPRRRT
ncbi:Exocyst complex component EXO70B1 [Zea mays]|jgi:exocyst complex component 7|uniref:Exocyst subunit Exo70 family protein n=2 Tax=Zea mays TaxID=4577 RepID=A0A1D6QMN1_MAIZE|nr:exocyst complex component EXO70B1 [Zea mays]AQK58908.1 exocyst subunit exo70 family protein C1 [Zea mays]PWZ29820.1 Exocyst complex component EXO70B1 [Zea mays]|eukprot:XP_020408436.1 exocyst complex component EXO70B1 [Zea mays]